MTITYVNGEYTVNAKHTNSKELIMELSLAIHMLAQDEARYSEGFSEATQFNYQGGKPEMN